jgi:hypothetical protein
LSALFKSKTSTMLPQRFNTIADLQDEQDRLQANMRLTRQEFLRSASVTKNGTKDFLLKNILLPVGAVGLGVFIANQISGHQKSRQVESEVTEDADAAVLRSSGEAVRTKPPDKGTGWLAKLMLVALPFMQQFFIKIKENVDADGRQSNTGALGVLSTLVPIAVPMMQQYFISKDEESKEHIVIYGSGGPQTEVDMPKHGAEAIFESLYKLLPVVLPLMQQFFASGKQPLEREQTTDYARNRQYAEPVG